MSVSADILAACGGRCGLSSLPLPTVAQLAGEFGLSDDESCYKEVD